MLNDSPNHGFPHRVTTTVHRPSRIPTMKPDSSAILR